MKLALLIISLVGLLAPRVVFGADRPFRVSFSSPSTIYLPLWLAQDAGLFAKQKISIESVYLGSSPIASAALFAGELDVIGGGGTVGPTAHLRGYPDLVIFAALSQKFPFALYAHRSIKTLAELKGKRLGVTRFGGTLDFATRYFLKRSGLNPNKDVALIQIGAGSDIVVALQKGSINAGVLALPDDIKARELGFQELLDFSQTDARYPTPAFVAKKQFLINNKLQMLGFIKGLTEAVYFIKKKRQESLKILANHMRTTDLKSLELSLDMHLQRFWPLIPEVKAEDIKLMLEHVSETNPNARELNPTELVWDSLVAEVANSGFVERLQ